MAKQRQSANSPAMATFGPQSSEMREDDERCIHREGNHQKHVADIWREPRIRVNTNQKMFVFESFILGNGFALTSLKFKESPQQRSALKCWQLCLLYKPTSQSSYLSHDILPAMTPNTQKMRTRSEAQMSLVCVALDVDV